MKLKSKVGMARGLVLLRQKQSSRALRPNHYCCWVILCPVYDRLSQPGIAELVNYLEEKMTWY